MFVLKRIVIYNFQMLHNIKRPIETSSGIIGIIGTNGVGKSSFLRSIQYLLTGECDGRSKADLLRRGTDDGYVLGEFVLNDQPGVISRSLVGTPTQTYLEWGGKKYRKVNEMKKAWNDIFHLDANTFSNVVMAQQSQIELLFSGDPIVRDRIFQKLFNVPNLEGIRSTMWRNYMSKLNGERVPVGNVGELKVKLKELEAEAAKLKDKADKLKVNLLNDQDYKNTVEWTIYLRKAQALSLERADLDEKLKISSSNLKVLNDTLAGLEGSIASSDPSGTKDQYERLLKNKTLSEAYYERKTAIIALESQALKAPVIEELKKQYNIAKDSHTKLTVERSQLDFEVSTFSSYLKFIRMGDNCPMCESKIKDKNYLITRFSNNIDNAGLKREELDTELARLEKIVAKLKEVIDSQDKLRQQIITLTESLPDTAYEFNQTEFSIISDKLEHIKTLQEQVTTIKIRSAETAVKVKEFTDRLNQIPVNVEDSHEKLAAYEKMVVDHDEIKKQVDALTNSLNQVTSQMTLTNELIVSANKATEHNGVIDTAHSILKEVYDAFSPTDFPRKLLTEYASLIENHLVEQLERFHLPYIVKVDPTFAISVYNDGGYKLPEVSGGEQVIIGLCLRLALHKIFGNAFPMLIIDEGTTHLHEDNVKLYANMLKELKQGGGFNQIFIVDHHEILKNSMDEIIPLDKSQATGIK